MITWTIYKIIKQDAQSKVKITVTKNNIYRKACVELHKDKRSNLRPREGIKGILESLMRCT